MGKLDGWTLGTVRENDGYPTTFHWWGGQVSIFSCWKMALDRRLGLVDQLHFYGNAEADAATFFFDAENFDIEDVADAQNCITRHFAAM